MSHQSFVTGSGLNMRAQPQVAPDNIIKVLPQNERLDVRGNDGVWLFVQHQGQAGFVIGTGTESTAPPDNAEVIWNTKITSLGLNMRPAPSPDAEPVVKVLAQHAMLDVLGYVVLSEDDMWVRVRHEGQVGFVNSKHTALLPTTMHTQEDQQATDLDALMAKDRLNSREIRRVRQLIAQEFDMGRKAMLYESLQSKVPYRSQRDNEAVDRQGNKVETTAGQMCNLTSLAMCLQYLGISSPDPNKQFEDALEDFRVAHGLPHRTTSDGWGGVASKLGAQVTFVGSAVTKGQDWYEANVRPVLRAGNSVMMSIGGHIVRLQAVTNEGLIVDDPYGRCTLLPGEERKWKYHQFNEFGKTGQMVGEDNLWKWADVSKHTMRWIAQIGLPAGAPPVAAGEAPTPAPMPEEHFEDDGIVVEEEQSQER